MDIKALSASQRYAAVRDATRPAETEPQQTQTSGTPGQAFGQVMRDFAQTLATSEATSKTAMVTGADPHALVTALAQTELAVETAVTVRNKVVEAYQEILRMPV